MSTITWIPEKDIVAAARMFAGIRPSCIIQRVPIDQNCNAVQTSRAILILDAICGTWTKKVGICFQEEGMSLPKMPLEASCRSCLVGSWRNALEQGKSPFSADPMVPAERFHPTLWARAILTGEPYPIRAQITSANNQILRDQNSKISVEALRKLDFSVTMDLFMTPTAELSDIVLPAVSWLERGGLRGHPDIPTLFPFSIEPSSLFMSDGMTINSLLNFLREWN